MFDLNKPFTIVFEEYTNLIAKKRDKKNEQQALYHEFLTYARQRAETDKDKEALKWVRAADNVFSILDREDIEPIDFDAKKDENSELEEEGDDKDEKEISFQAEVGDCLQAESDVDDYYDNKPYETFFEKESRKGDFQEIDYPAYDLALFRLNKMIGLKNVKETAEEVSAFARIQKMKIERGLTSQFPCFHMAFSGSPGCGKTTVARHFADIFKSLGLLSKGHLVEVSKSDLVGCYVGWTERQTSEIFKKALDGVLFIDEAHLLYDSSNQYDFGHECLTTLIKLMEDYRERVIVIFAGYKEQMENNLFRFEGMESRVPYKINFVDYSAHEMTDIFKIICEDNNYKISNETLISLRKFISKKIKSQNKKLNGREVRNLFEKSLVLQAKRLSSISEPTDSDLLTLKAVDLELIDAQEKDNVTYIHSS